MEIDTALSKVYEDSEISSRLEGKFFCSALSFLSDFSVNAWELSFYDPESNKITQITVNDSVSVKMEGDPFKKTEIKEIIPDDLNVGASKALEIAKEHYSEKYRGIDYSKIFFSLHSGEKPIWSLTIVTKQLTLVLISIDAVSGEIISSDVHQIFDKSKLGGFKSSM